MKLKLKIVGLPYIAFSPWEDIKQFKAVALILVYSTEVINVDHWESISIGFRWPFIRHVSCFINSDDLDKDDKNEQ